MRRSTRWKTRSRTVRSSSAIGGRRARSVSVRRTGSTPRGSQMYRSRLPPGDLNIFIDVPEEEALRRRPEMRDRFEKDREKQKVVRANYETLWETNAK